MFRIFCGVNIFRPYWIILGTTARRTKRDVIIDVSGRPEIDLPTNFA